MLLVVLASSYTVSASGAEEADRVVAGNYVVSLVTIPQLVVAGEPVVLELHVEDQTEQPVVSDNVQVEISRVKYPMRALAPGVYQYNTTFKRFGAGMVDFYVNETLASIAFNVELPERKSNAGAVALSVALAITLALAVLTLTKKMRLTSALTFGVIGLIATGLGYSVAEYKSSPAVQGCLLQVGDAYVLHCHYHVYLTICGELKKFSWESGSLSGAHTHKDSHLMDWHPPEPVADPAALLTLRNGFKDLQIVLNETAVGDPETGKVYHVGQDDCGTGTPGQLKAYITPKETGVKIPLNSYLDTVIEDFFADTPLPKDNSGHQEKARIEVVYS